MLNIIFSYNRAMQLDYLLKTTLSRFKNFDFETVVLYHTTGDHKLGYQKLIEKYQKHHHIKFVERKKSPFDPALFRTLTDKANIRFFINRNLRNKESDLFKSQLESIISNSKHELLMFNTDDGIFYQDVYLDDEILKIFKDHPKETSYRMYVGENIEDFPNFVKKTDNHFEWDYYASKQVTHWTYPFSVDGTIYNAKKLLQIIKKVSYHNPITLEQHTFRYVLKHKALSKGLGPIHSKLVGTILNRVSVDSFNPTLDISVDFLNSKFVEGYELLISLPEKIDVVNLVPRRVSIVKNGFTEIIHEDDYNAQQVQNKYSNEGSKRD